MKVKKVNNQNNVRSTEKFKIISANSVNRIKNNSTCINIIIGNNNKYL